MVNKSIHQRIISLLQAVALEAMRTKDEDADRLFADLVKVLDRYVPPDTGA